MERYEPELNGYKLQRGTVLKHENVLKLVQLVPHKPRITPVHGTSYFFRYFSQRNLKRKNLNKSEITKLFFTEIGR